MRFLVSVLMMLLFAWIAGMFLPWYSIALITFLVGLAIPQKLWRSFLAGFLAIFLLWFMLAFWLDTRNEQLLSRKIAELMHLGHASILLILITAVVGGLVGGFAALSGASLRATR
jgi:hypothetical protein